MNLREMDSLEMVMAIEEVLGIEIPGNIGQFESPSELLDRLEAILSNRRPNIEAVALLRKIAKDRQQPELAEGLERTWRREQSLQLFAKYFAISTDGRYITIGRGF